MTTDSPTVAFVLARDAPLAAVDVLGRFRAKGWDAHLIHDGGSPAFVERLAAQPHDVLLHAVHPPPPTQRNGRHAATGRLSMRLLGELARHPTTVAATLWPRGVPPSGRRSAFYSAAVVTALRPQIVHFQSATAAAQGVDGRRLAAKVVVSLTDADLAMLFDGSSDAAPLEAADMIVVPAGPIGERALDRGLLPKSCCALPSPLPESLESTGGAELRILSIGEVTWRQGYEHGIHAIRLLLDRGVACRYRLIGTGIHEGALRFARSQLGVESEVELVGSIETAPLGQELASADVFLDPAVAESPTTFAALAVELGVPVVTTRDLPQDDPVEFVHARRRDPGALAEGLEGLAATAGVLARRVARASSVEESPSLAAITDRLAELYLRLLDESAPVRG